MPTAEFEERSFEIPTVVELVGKDGRLHPPGQALEHFVGYDMAVYTDHQAFWGFFGMTPRPGKVIGNSWWPSLPRRARLSFPAFRLNLFIQFKRPCYLSAGRGRRPKEWDYWRAPYYRYSVDDHQQSLLEALATHLGADGLVVYDAPCFHTWKDLYEYMNAGEIVAHSSFVEVTSLSKHKHYTYCQPGRAGKAFSKEEAVEHLDLKAAINARCERQAGRQNGELFSVAGEAFDRVIQEHRCAAVSKYYVEHLRSIADDLERRVERELWKLVLGWLKTRIGSYVLGLTWLVAGSEPIERPE